jgi:hypothetical protein
MGNFFGKIGLFNRSPIRGRRSFTGSMRRKTRTPGLGVSSFLILNAAIGCAGPQMRITRENRPVPTSQRVVTLGPGVLKAQNIEKMADQFQGDGRLFPSDHLFQLTCIFRLIEGKTLPIRFDLYQEILETWQSIAYLELDSQNNPRGLPTSIRQAAGILAQSDSPNRAQWQALVPLLMNYENNAQ